MLELITVVTLVLLVRFLINPHQKKKSYAVKKGNNWNRKTPESIIGASTFVLNTKRQKQILDKKPKEPPSDSSGKMDIEVPLDYEPEDTNLLEELEELERLGLQNDYSSNLTFDEMMLVVNEVGSDQPESSDTTGKLLYENENTDWVEQLSSSSGKNASRITALIDLHLGRLEQPNSNLKTDEVLRRGFDIGEYVGCIIYPELRQQVK